MDWKKGGKIHKSLELLKYKGMEIISERHSNFIDEDSKAMELSSPWRLMINVGLMLGIVYL